MTAHKEAGLDKGQLLRSLALSGLGGLLVGGMAYRAHRPLSSGKSSYEVDLETEREAREKKRDPKQKPGRFDAIREEIDRGRKDYATWARTNPGKAALVEGGTMAGGSLLVDLAGSALLGKGSGGGVSLPPLPAHMGMRKSAALREAAVLQAADVVGISRAVLMKKAALLAVPLHEALRYELRAMGLADRGVKTAADRDFLNTMARVQTTVTGHPPVSPPFVQVNRGLSGMWKSASLGELLAARASSAPSDPMTEAAAELVRSTRRHLPVGEVEPERTALREERSRALLGLFGKGESGS